MRWTFADNSSRSSRKPGFFVIVAVVGIAALAPSRTQSQSRGSETGTVGAFENARAVEDCERAKQLLGWEPGDPLPAACGGNDGSDRSLEACDELRREIVEIKQRVAAEQPRFSEISDRLDRLDRQTRVNFCTKDLDHRTAVGVLEFDDSWRHWAQNKMWWVSWLNELPMELAGAPGEAVKEGVSQTLDGLNLTLDLFTAHEREQLPVDEAWATYQRIRRTRNETLGNLQRALELHYCRKIFDEDAKLYHAYHTEIPAKCPEEQVVNVRRLLRRNRPERLAPIWVEDNYELASTECAKLPGG